MSAWTLTGHLKAMRSAGAYRPMRLHALVLGECDENGTASFAMDRLRRELASGDFEQCAKSEVLTAIRHLEVAGVLKAGSSPRHLQLTGCGEAA